MKVFNLHATQSAIDAFAADYVYGLKGEAQEAPPLTMSVADLAGKPVPERQWIVRDVVPDRQVTLLYGDGGTGKSLIAMQLAASVALRENNPLQDWLGVPIVGGGAVYIGAEDEMDEMHIRLSDILAANDATFDDVPNLRICSLAGEDALMAVERGPHSPLDFSPLYHRVDDTLKQYDPKLLVLDTLADMYPASEIDRAKVRQFVNMLKRLAIKHECAVVMLAHPSKSGMTTGRGDSGSTAWNGSVRSRLFFEFVANDEGYIEDHDARRLTVMKSNYGRPGQRFNVRYEDGCFMVQPTDTPMDRAAASAKAERVFMALLRIYTEQGRNLNASSGANYAPSQFSQHPDSEGISRRMFKQAMENLFAKGAIRNEVAGRSNRIVEV